jgi:hypothetical protein
MAEGRRCRIGKFAPKSVRDDDDDEEVVVGSSGRNNGDDNPALVWSSQCKKTVVPSSRNATVDRDRPNRP